MGTRTGGRPATSGVIPGRYALSVGLPDIPLPGGWRWTQLTDVARLETGHTPSRKHPEYWGGDIPWIGIKDATKNHGSVIYDTIQHTNELGIMNSSARILPAATVCLSRTASVGYIVVMGRPMATSQDFVNWVCTAELSSDFLKYVLLAEGDSFLRFASGTTHQTIYFPEVKAFHIALPPLPEQKAIAAVLSSLDDKIDLLHRQNKTLEAMAQTLFRQWFVEEADDSWEEGRLSDIAEFNPLYQLRKHQPSPYLEMSNVNENSFHPKTWINREFSSGMKFVNGDTLLARITPCLENGKTCFVSFLAENQIGWGSTEFIVIRMKPPFHPFLSYLIAKNKEFRSHAINSMSGTSGRQRAQASLVSEFAVAIPEGDRINQLNKLSDAFLKKLHYNFVQIQTLSKLRDTLLPKLMSGEIKVAI